MIIIHKFNRILNIITVSVIGTPWGGGQGRNWSLSGKTFFWWYMFQKCLMTYKKGYLYNIFSFHPAPLNFFRWKPMCYNLFSIRINEACTTLIVFLGHYSYNNTSLSANDRYNFDFWSSSYRDTVVCGSKLNSAECIDFVLLSLTRLTVLIVRS